jgi:hypothetical protein
VFDRSLLLPSFAALTALLVLAPLAVVSAEDPPKKSASVLDFHVKDIDGKDVDLAKFRGKVLLIVNTASQCGFTPQYKDLEAVYDKYKAQDLEVLAFPANEFGSQEPGTDEQSRSSVEQLQGQLSPLLEDRRRQPEDPSALRLPHEQVDQLSSPEILNFASSWSTGTAR